MRRSLALGQTLDQTQPETQRMPPVAVVGIRFKCAVPVGMADIGGAYGNTAAARLGDKLRGRIEPHRLCIEKRADEDIRIMPLDPGRDIDQQRKAGGVGFGKSVSAESFNLAKTPFGEFRRVAALDHAADHLVVELADIAMSS